MKNISIRKLVLAAMFLALALLLPFLTGQIPVYGKMLCPMHFPVLLCGFICGPWWGLVVGIVAAPLRSLLFAMPAAPTCYFMAVELAVYGCLAGLLYKWLPKKIPFLFISLLLSMIAGRITSGLLQWIIYGINGKTYTSHAFLTAHFVGSWPGILLQILLIPLILTALTRAKQIPLDR